MPGTLLHGIITILHLDSLLTSSFTEFYFIRGLLQNMKSFLTKNCLKWVQIQKKYATAAWKGYAMVLPHYVGHDKNIR